MLLFKDCLWLTRPKAQTCRKPSACSAGWTSFTTRSCVRASAARSGASRSAADGQPVRSTRRPQTGVPPDHGGQERDPKGKGAGNFLQGFHRQRAAAVLLHLLQKREEGLLICRSAQAAAAVEGFSKVKIPWHGVTSQLPAVPAFLL